MSGSVDSHPLTVWSAMSFAQYVSAGPSSLIPLFSAGTEALLPSQGQRVARCAAHDPDLAGTDPVVDDLREALAQRAEVLADDGEVVRAGDERPFLVGKPHPSRRIRRVRDAGVLGFQDGVGDVRALVGITDDEIDAGLDQEPDVAGGDRRVRVPLGVTEHHLADLRVRERLQDGLHPRHLTPDVQPAAVGVPHDDVAAGAGVALASRPSTPSPCRSWPGRDLGTPAPRTPG